MGLGAERVDGSAVNPPDPSREDVDSDHADEVADAAGDHALDRLTPRQRAIMERATLGVR